MYHIYLINDHIHAYHYVSKCLMETLGHLPIQAEQCCLITQNIGKCHIKSGDYMDLLLLQDELKNKNLTVELHPEMQL